MTDELKACPFCDGKSLREVTQTGFWKALAATKDQGPNVIKCDDCGASGPYNSAIIPERNAKWKWNNRPEIKTKK